MFDASLEWPGMVSAICTSTTSWWLYLLKALGRYITIQICWILELTTSLRLRTSLDTWFCVTLLFSLIRISDTPPCKKIPAENWMNSQIRNSMKLPLLKTPKFETTEPVDFGFGTLREALTDDRWHASRENRP